MCSFGSGNDVLEPVTPEDLPAIRALIAAVIRHSVARSEEDARFLIEDIDASLLWWRAHPDDAIHLKHCHAEAIVGVVLVKHFWNLCDLFVAPDCQRRGIGTLLVTEALKLCRHKSPRAALLVNSSTVAVGFYERLGFRQTGPGLDRPGGCVPFRYDFNSTK